MKRFALFTSLTLILGACGTNYVYVTGDGNNNPPGNGDDGGTPVDEAGNPIQEDANTPPPSNATLATGLTITDVAVFQGVKVLVVKGGTPVASRNAPVVANRDARIRVYVTPDGSWAPHAVVGYLTVNGSGGSVTLHQGKIFAGTPNDADTNTLLEFDVPAANMTTDATFSVKIIDSKGSGSNPSTSPAQYPNDGSTMSLGAKSSGSQIKIYMFPVITNGITPPTDAAHVKILQNLVYDLYPIPSVQITVQAPIKYSGSAPQAGGSGWSTMLNWFLQKRQTDNPPDDVYYYAAFTPTSSFAQYCSSGCVAGLSSLATNVTDVWARASIGLDYEGQNDSLETAYTMAHEVGHAHGRAHAPCGGAAQPDPQFPYSGGGIGVWGYALIEKGFVDPSKGHDLMGYCPDYDWISDYTYNALFNRLKYVNGADFHYSPEQRMPREYRVVYVGENEALSWGDVVTVRAPVAGEEHQVSYLGADGKTIQTVTGYYYAYDHLPGGYLLVPKGPQEIGGVAIANLGSHAVATLAK